MKRLVIVFFAWWFLGIGPGGGGALNRYVVLVGPFNDRNDCRTVANWSRENDVKASPCWFSENKNEKK